MHEAAVQVVADVGEPLSVRTLTPATGSKVRAVTTPISLLPTKTVCPTANPESAHDRPSVRVTVLPLNVQLPVAE